MKAANRFMGGSPAESRLVANKGGTDEAIFKLRLCHRNGSVPGESAHKKNRVQNPVFLKYGDPAQLSGGNGAGVAANERRYATSAALSLVFLTPAKPMEVPFTWVFGL